MVDQTWCTGITQHGGRSRMGMPHSEMFSIQPDPPSVPGTASSLSVPLAAKLCKINANAHEELWLLTKERNVTGMTPSFIR
jgi:hypothetical protein